jgi:hypothetical protein
MAREVPERPVALARTNWSRFDTGTTWELLQGEDFQQTPKAAAHAVRQWAAYHGRRVLVNVCGDRIRLFIQPK